MNQQNRPRQVPSSICRKVASPRGTCLGAGRKTPGTCPGPVRGRRGRLDRPPTGPRQNPNNLC
eukprot:7421902-Lingulodinium_polyedra.AAC.1